jgi:sec-independent protein translocase protein TatC
MTRFPHDPDDVRMSLGEHLGELRRRLILALVGLAVTFAVCFAFQGRMVKFIVQPVSDAVNRVNAEVRQRSGAESPVPAKPPSSEPVLVVLTPMEGFTTIMRTVLVAAALISSPWILYQFWLFVAAGLYPAERRVVHMVVPFSAILFIGGAVFAYTVVVKYGLYALLTFGGLVGDIVKPELRLSSSINFVLMMSLLMGAVFELPLVMFALSKVGLVDPQFYTKHWRYSVAGIFVAAAVLTPTPDAFTMIAMALPMLVLYWLGVFLARMFVK